MHCSAAVQAWCPEWVVDTVSPSRSQDIHTVLRCSGEPEINASYWSTPELLPGSPALVQAGVTLDTLAPLTRGAKGAALALRGHTPSGLRVVMPLLNTQGWKGSSKPPPPPTDPGSPPGRVGTQATRPPHWLCKPGGHRLEALRYSRFEWRTLGLGHWDWEKLDTVKSWTQCQIKRID